MQLSNKNRLAFSELEGLVEKWCATGRPNYQEGDIRNDWKTLYHICKLMGLKLEKRSSHETEVHSLETKKTQELDVGFRHETYKNYYLLRGVKRTISNIIKEGIKMTEGDWWFKEKEMNEVFKSYSEKDTREEIIIKAILDQEPTLNNFELLRFFGEDLRFNKDRILCFGLRNILFQEQEIAKNGKVKTLLDNQNSTRLNRNKRAAVTISIMVAGSYPFCEENLDYLDLSGAYLRGGMFTNTSFQKTNLTGANLRHANISGAKFIEANLKKIDVGIGFDLSADCNVECLSFSPDGRQIISSGIGALKVSDVSTGECLNIITREFTYSHSISPDGRKIAIAYRYSKENNAVEIRRFPEGDCTLKLVGHEKEVLHVKFHPDNKILASSSYHNTIKIWDTDDGTCLQTLEGGQFIRHPCFHPGGHLLASCCQYEVKIWSWADNKCVNSLKGKTSDYIKALNFNQKGDFLVGAMKKNIVIWDFKTAQLLFELSGHSADVLCISISPDNKSIASSGEDRTVKLWDFQTGECLQTLYGHLDKVYAVCFSPDSKQLTSSGYDQKIKFWNIGSIGTSIQTLHGHKGFVSSISLSPDGKYFATCGGDQSDKSVKIWNLINGECTQTLEGHTFRIDDVCFSPDNKKLASGGADYKAKIWDLERGICLHTLEYKSAGRNSVSFSPDGQRLATTNDKKIIVWSVENGTILFTIEQDQRVIKASFSPNGQMLANYCGHEAGTGGSINIWDSLNQTCLRTIKGPNLSPSCFSPDSRVLATFFYNWPKKRELQIWNISDGNCEKTFALELEGNLQECLTFSSEGKFLLFSTGKNGEIITVWDTETGASVNFKGHDDRINSMKFSRDSKYLVSSSGDEKGFDVSLKIWIRSLDEYPTKGKPIHCYYGFINCVEKEQEFKCSESLFQGCETDEIFEKLIPQRNGILKK